MPRRPPGGLRTPAEPGTPEDMPSPPEAVGPRKRAELAAFSGEIRAELRYEKGLAIKAVITFMLVAALLAAHVCFFT